ncbi:protein N-terminal and lysine N-methyltransferase efm7 isoform X1 [Raphanus sativus]|uniref:Protein N-terminal and lysine N-methyltransferase efm7 isoform X1 n=1 Tax=Raphanus sativus TaxID=3726 RepID=A0A6J0MI96_RAPSA|nr:protein N-terminal and lysine N-methyltransferase efm7 isoform X1 [Raphanus sativus]
MDIALFSPSSLFAADDDSSDGETTETSQSFVDRNHQFPGMELNIREFGFHQLNANLLWPGSFAFADWLVQRPHLIRNRRCLEIGSGTGALAIFLKKEFNLDITTSDYDDQEIQDNIAHNCTANNITPSLPHINHTWGDEFPTSVPDWDLIIASDILLYVKQYPNLIKSLSFLLKSYKPKDTTTNAVSPSECKPNVGAESDMLPWPVFLMSWRRRIGKEDESLFFSGCQEAGFEVKHLGNRVYCISLTETNL